MKTIPNFPGYLITKDGRIWCKPYIDTIGRKRKGKWIKTNLVFNGYMAATLHKNRKQYHCFVHRLVLETFVSKCTINMECRHLDGNKLNNNLNNLKWGTSKENTADRKKHGTMYIPNLKGEDCGQAKLSNQDVKTIFKMLKNNVARHLICFIYEITDRHLRRIKNGKRWAWMKGV